MFKKVDRSTKIFIAGGVGFILIIQLLISLGVLNTFWSTILKTGAVMAIVSLGLNLIYGFNGQFSLGQWGFYAIGAYTAADITYRWSNNQSADGLTILLLVTIFSGIIFYLFGKLFSTYRGVDQLSQFSLYTLAVIAACWVAVQIGNAISPAISSALIALPSDFALHLVFFFAVLLGGAISAGISFLFGLPVLTLGSDYFGIATLGLTIIVKVLLDNSDTMLGFEEMKGARGMIGIPKVTTWLWVALFLFVILIVVRNLLLSTYGRAIISVREDEIAAKAMGIDIANYKILTFVLGSFFAGIAGGLYAHINGFLHPNTFNFLKSFDPMIIVVFGGLGSVTGTVAAAFTWALVLEGFLRLVLPEGFETWRFVVYPVLLLIMMLLKPQGLFGGYEIPFLQSKVPPLRKKTDASDLNNHSTEPPSSPPGMTVEDPKAS